LALPYKLGFRFQVVEICVLNGFRRAGHRTRQDQVDTVIDPTEDCYNEAPETLI